MGEEQWTLYPKFTRSDRPRSRFFFLLPSSPALARRIRWVGSGGSYRAPPHGKTAWRNAFTGSALAKLDWPSSAPLPPPPPSPNHHHHRHVFSIVLGSWMLMFTFQGQWVHVPLCALLCYAIMALGGPRARYVTASVAMLYLSCMHLYRQFTAYLTWSIDVTFSQMIITQKLFALSFNYYGVAHTPACHVGWDGTAGRRMVRWS